MKRGQDVCWPTPLHCLDLTPLPGSGWSLEFSPCRAAPPPGPSASAGSGDSFPSSVFSNQEVGMAS